MKKIRKGKYPIIRVLLFHLIFSKQSYFLILLGQGLYQVYYKFRDRRRLKRIHFRGKAKERSQPKSSGRDISNLVFLQNYYQGPLGNGRLDA